MLGRLSSRREEQEGAIAIIVAVSSVLIFVLAAMVVDLGLARDTRRQAQNASDASALAAGNALYAHGVVANFDDAVAAAKNLAAENYGIDQADWDSCSDDDPLAYHHLNSPACISFDHATEPTEVRVVAPVREVKTGLAGIVGVSEVQISALAHAALEPADRLDCGLCIVGDGPHDLQNGDVVVDTDIHFNGDVGVGPNGLVSTEGSISVEGDASGSASNYQPDPQTGQPAIPDPLAFLPLPPDYSTLTAGSNPCTGGPGIYAGFNSSCTNLQPGLYVITGEWKFTGSENLTAAGVTLYFTCGTPSDPRECNDGEGGGWLNAAGNGTISISAPTSGPTKGLAIVYDRQNTQQLKLSGNGEHSLYKGTIYAPRATMDYRGNGAGEHNSLIVVGSLAFSGNNATLRSAYDGPVNVDIPPAKLHLSN